MNRRVVLLMDPWGAKINQKQKHIRNRTNTTYLLLGPDCHAIREVEHKIEKDDLMWAIAVENEPDADVMRENRTGQYGMGHSKRR